MRVLVLEPYLGGSHKALFEGWVSRSRHHWDLLTMPANRSPWRMRHATLAFASEVSRRAAAGEKWDVILCSDMLDLAEFRGLVCEPVRSLPAVPYFFENELTCPLRREGERDFHHVFANVTSTLAATEVWFNSAFHRDDFLAGLPEFLERFPTDPPLDAAEQIRAKSVVRYAGIESVPARGPRPPGPMRILWVARWEHDKNPETFFDAVKILKWHGAEFRLSVLGQQFLEHPPAFDWARQYFYYHIDWWGYQPTRRDYEDALAEADVVVSTADHEFFGLSIIEAIAAGAYPLLPNRLAYPEILNLVDSPEAREFYYEGGGPQALAERLIDLSDRTRRNDLWQGDPERARRLVARFHWDNVIPALDDAVEQVAART
jgi:glycosyltransferase involved in cell wall biosynthesis